MSLTTPYDNSVNKFIGGQVSALAPSSAFVQGYVPTIPSKVLSVSIGGSGYGKCDILFGTTGVQALIATIYISNSNLNAKFKFDEYINIDSTQTFQVNVWNLDINPQDITFSIQIHEG